METVAVELETGVRVLCSGTTKLMRPGGRPGELDRSCNWRSRAVRSSGTTTASEEIYGKKQGESVE